MPTETSLIRDLVLPLLETDLPPIVQLGHPALRQPALPYDGQLDDGELAAFISLMRRVMHAAPGVGLAAPQLGIPLQVAVLLSEPGRDFAGGEFVLTEQRPRMQSRAEVVPLGQGDAVVFAVNQRPVQGTRGVYRVAMRHGVSRLRRGMRHTLGIIFHDAS